MLHITLLLGRFHLQQMFRWCETNPQKGTSIPSPGSSRLGWCTATSAPKGPPSPSLRLQTRLFHPSGAARASTSSTNWGPGAISLENILSWKVHQNMPGERPIVCVCVLKFSGPNPKVQRFRKSMKSCSSPFFGWHHPFSEKPSSFLSREPPQSPYLAHNTSGSYKT